MHPYARALLGLTEADVANMRPAEIALLEELILRWRG